ncbi:hypothetical protein R1sor_010610 [Riccia sorocarpa]|uniref:O-fucosyltransferase family protein n=1 Tax=Riccia sorocarpa TaxID=122646 RepID=A0ABD3I0F2_9MARC
MSTVQKTVIGVSVLGLMVLLLNMFGNRPPPLAYDRALSISTKDSTLLTPLVTQSERGWHVPKKTLVDKVLEAKLWGKGGPKVPMEPCWSKRISSQADKADKAWGYVAITCSNGPHNHRAQIADAVVIAFQLGATLVVPTVKEALKEPHSRFDDLYNVRNFISSLEGMVRVVGQLPKDFAKGNKSITSIPLKVTREYIEEKLRPVFRKDRVLYLGNFLPALKKQKDDPELTALRCLVMFKALRFVIAIQKLGNRIVNRLREAAPQSAPNRFVSIDLQVDALRQKTCNATIAKKKRCLEPSEVGLFLRKLGYPSDTAIYLTQSRWESVLDPLQNMYQNVHTKEYSMPFNEENQYLFSGKTQFERAIDFYVCSKADVFVPTVPGVFYAHVSGERISEGLDHIIVPSIKYKPGSRGVQISGGISPYVGKKSHPVYSCFCESSPKTTSESVAKLSTERSEGSKKKKSDNDVLPS